jgi:hypothetical protein
MTQKIKTECCDECIAFAPHGRYCLDLDCICHKEQEFLNSLSKEQKSIYLHGKLQTLCPIPAEKECYCNHQPKWGDFTKCDCPCHFVEKPVEKCEHDWESFTREKDICVICMEKRLKPQPEKKQEWDRDVELTINSMIDLDKNEHDYINEVNIYALKIYIKALINKLLSEKEAEVREGLVKKIKQSKLFTMGGSCWECCDYEGICDDIIKTISLPK